jgi:hypothetical protein
VVKWYYTDRNFWRTEYLMAKAKGGYGIADSIESKPKKTRQGTGQHTKYSATSRNKAKKRYRGQGK